MLRYPTHKEVAVMHSDGVRLHGRAGIPGTALVGANTRLCSDAGDIYSYIAALMIPPPGGSRAPFLPPFTGLLLQYIES